MVFYDDDNRIKNENKQHYEHKVTIHCDVTDDFVFDEILVIPSIEEIIWWCSKNCKGKYHYDTNCIDLISFQLVTDAVHFKLVFG